VTFDFETEVDVRYSDVDTYGHVNNAVYATFVEDARVDYLDAVLDADDAESGGLTGMNEDGVGIVVANLELEFRTPVGPVDSVTVGVRVPELGRSSFPFEYEIRSDGDVAAVGETTMVAYDRGAGEACPVPAAWRDRITQFEGL